MPVNLKLHTKSKEELTKLADQVKISNLSYSEKTMLLRDIEVHMGDVDLAKQRRILVEIQEGMADTEDLVS